MEFFNVHNRPGHGINDLWVYQCAGFVKFPLRYTQRFGSQVRTIDGVGEIQQRFVPNPAHVVYNAVYDLRSRQVLAPHLIAGSLYAR